MSYLAKVDVYIGYAQQHVLRPASVVPCPMSMSCILQSQSQSEILYLKFRSDALYRVMRLDRDLSAPSSVIPYKHFTTPSNPT